MCVCVCVCVCVRAYLCRLHHKLIRFYNRDEKRLQRGTD